LIGFAAGRLMELEVGARNRRGRRSSRRPMFRASRRGSSMAWSRPWAFGISKSQVSRLCEEIDGKVTAFLDRPPEGDWPYLRIDAGYRKVRRGGRIVSVAVIIAIGVNTDGRREVPGLETGTWPSRSGPSSCAS
jgi:transposase-like protein